jgi:hypothetical protein
MFQLEQGDVSIGAKGCSNFSKKILALAELNCTQAVFGLDLDAAIRPPPHTDPAGTPLWVLMGLKFTMTRATAKTGSAALCT